MQLSSLLTRLPKDAIAGLSLGDPTADVYTLAYLTQRMTTVRDDVLYFGDFTLVSAVELPESPNLVLYGSGTPTELTRDRPQANVVELADAADPYECYNALQAYFLEDQEQAAIIRRMLAAHFSNEGLQYLVEESACALGNPIVVVDTSLRSPSDCSVNAPSVSLLTRTTRLQ